MDRDMIINMMIECLKETLEGPIPNPKRKLDMVDDLLLLEKLKKDLDGIDIQIIAIQEKHGMKSMVYDGVGEI